jgi:hypothetical protein
VAITGRHRSLLKVAVLLLMKSAVGAAGWEPDCFHLTVGKQQFAALAGFSQPHFTPTQSFAYYMEHSFARSLAAAGVNTYLPDFQPVEEPPLARCANYKKDEEHLQRCWTYCRSHDKTQDEHTQFKDMLFPTTTASPSPRQTSLGTPVLIV